MSASDETLPAAWEGLFALFDDPAFPANPAKPPLASQLTKSARHLSCCWFILACASRGPKSSVEANHGEASKALSLPRWPGSTASIIARCWSPSAINRRPKPRNVTTQCWRTRRCDTTQTKPPPATLVDQRKQKEAHTLPRDRAARLISHFAGSMDFVYLHLMILFMWIVWNVGLIPSLEPWDPTFVILAMAASVEATFLSTFVLIAQNRMAERSARKAELDLQITLLNKHETTRLIDMVAALAERPQRTVNCLSFAKTLIPPRLSRRSNTLKASRG